MSLSIDQFSFYAKVFLQGFVKMFLSWQKKN